MIGLIASIRVAPADAEALERVFEPYVASVHRDEPGTTAYHFLKDRETPGRYRIVEVYRDQAALDAHRRSPAFAAFRPSLGALLLEPPVSEWFDVIV